jgi:GMP synthase (glutamine-hydrolysing)
MIQGPKKIVILKTGTSFGGVKSGHGDFEDWIVSYAGLTPNRVSVVDPAKEEIMPDAPNIAGVIITGSHAMVTDSLDWIERASQWIVALVQKEIPLLGICFGHQLLALAMGGEVDYHPRGREIGTVGVSLTTEGTQDELLGSFPNEFPAHATHAQTVIKLPQRALLLASNPFEPHHAFRIGRCAWGVQFHPEFSAAVMDAYIDYQAEELEKKGYDLPALKAGVIETPASNALIATFISLAC